MLYNQTISNCEKQLFKPKIKSSIKTCYGLLKEYGDTNLAHLKEKWEKELVLEISDEAWDEAWENAKSLSVCNRVKAIQLKILHRAHISPSQRHRFNSDLSPLCPKCQTEVGNLTHCLWSCRKIQQFWFSIKGELDKIFSIITDCNPLYMLLGMMNNNIKKKCERQLYMMLTFCARKCVLLNWISDKAPSKTQWQRTVLEYISLDFLTSKLNNRENTFHRIWDPYMLYAGLDISAIFSRGFL